MGYRIKDTIGTDEHDWSKLTFHTFEAAAKHAAFLNAEEERNAATVG